jgi:pyruvate-ferredoxin/flavodoxin oxidoreductase
VGGRYGLGSKDTTPADIVAVYENLDAAEPKNGFTIAIEDDVTNLSLKRGEAIDVTPEGTTNCLFWGLGSDGTVGANKNSIKIIGDHTDMYAQAYFDYDSKKSGGITNSHLRFGKSPIRSPYLVSTPDFVACHQQAYLTKYDMTSNIKPGGSFLLNTIWSDEELEQHLPANVKKDIATKGINFYTINAVKIGAELGLGTKFNMVLQSAFFMITEIIPKDDAIKYMKEFVVKSYGKKGEKIVNMNYGAIDEGAKGYHKVEVPESWKTIEVPAKETGDRPEFVKNVVDVMLAQKGNTLPVSAFAGIEDGTFEHGTAAYEKRGIAVHVPTWDPESCIQCGNCAFVCPHACIRPFLLTDEEAAAAPATVKITDAKGPKEKGYKYVMQVDVMDCLDCGNCVKSCPVVENGKGEPIKMVPFAEAEDQASAWDYVIALPHKENPENKYTVKGSQFEQPLLEFSGSCAGCAETAYARVITQLFGDSMYIANATGCSSIWGGSAPSTPYTTNHEGHGPAWCNSLFEDNAEFGLGMYTGVEKQRDTLKNKALALKETADDATKAAIDKWVETMTDREASKVASKELVAALEGNSDENAKYIVAHKDMLAKKSQWIFGGDGWAYDIGFGGVDHVLASGEDVNVFVFDTEVYSNTGGQASKATPAAAIAKFAAGGKKVCKKDLGMIEKSYGYVYVAQVCMSADKNQFLKALKEAEAYKGPSLIIAYAPCINHGFRNNFYTEAQKAVECGYWQLYRYNPETDVFTLDSTPTPDYDKFNEFITGEVRYTSLKRAFPEIADEMFEKCAADAKKRLDGYKKLAGK